MYIIKLKRLFLDGFIFFLCIAGFFAAGVFYIPWNKIVYYMPLDAVFSGIKESTVLTDKMKLIYSVLPLSMEEDKSESVPEDKERVLIVKESKEYTENGGMNVINSTGYTFDKDELLNTPLTFSDQQPKVLIYHTHTSEAYTPSKEYNYEESDPYRCEDTAYNIVLIGNRIKEVLENRGIGVVHDTTSHDFPSYSGSYNRSLESAVKDLTANPSIEIVLDIHRDAISDNNGGYLKTIAEIGGEKCAQPLIIVGTDAGGLEHPSWKNNLILGLKLQQKLNEMYPGLARALNLREERFNGNVSKGALLIEIGSNGNTTEEALRCAEYVGDAIAALIDQ